MEYRHLGSSALRISPIGFGCMSLGSDQAQNEGLIHRAIDAGINFFDTADLYNKGENERSVGQALKGKRENVVLATKVGNQWRPDGSGWDWNPRKAYILAAVEESLRRLQTSYLDLYQLHGGTINDPIDEVLEAFELLQQQGKIRYYGISSIRPNVIRAYASRAPIASVMMQYSLLDRRPEETCLPLLQARGIGVLARGSIAQGLLVNKPAKPYLNYSAEEVKKAAAAIDAVTTPGRSAAQAAIQFVLHDPAVTAAVVGMHTRAQLEEAVAAVSAPALSEAEMKVLQSVLPANVYQEHR